MAEKLVVRNDIDPFADDMFAPLDTRGLRTDPVAVLPERPTIATGFVSPTEQEEENGVVQNVLEETPTQETEPQPETPSQPPAPEFYEYADGSSVEIKKTNKGWVATLDSGAGSPEVFKGRTRDEVFLNLAAGKINATRKIRDMNQKAKSAVDVVREEAPARQVPQVRNLTADEIFEIKNQLAADPDLALQTWFQKKTGMSLEKLVFMAQNGSDAKNELTLEGVAKEFIEAHPEYVVHPNNYHNIIEWLAKHKLHVVLTNANQNAVLGDLLDKGFWSVPGIEEAYFSLLETDRLVVTNDKEDDEDEDEPVQAPTPVRKPVPDPRIEVRQTRPRRQSNVGIRQGDAVTVAPTTNVRVNAEDLENLSDDQINQLLTGVRRDRATSQRR